MPSINSETITRSMCNEKWWRKTSVAQWCPRAIKSPFVILLLELIAINVEWCSFLHFGCLLLIVSKWPKRPAKSLVSNAIYRWTRVTVTAHYANIFTPDSPSRAEPHISREREKRKLHEHNHVPFELWILSHISNGFLYRPHGCAHCLALDNGNQRQNSSREENAQSAVYNFDFRFASSIDISTVIDFPSAYRSRLSFSMRNIDHRYDPT